MLQHIMLLFAVFVMHDMLKHNLKAGTGMIRSHQPMRMLLA